MKERGGPAPSGRPTEAYRYPPPPPYRPKHGVDQGKKAKLGRGDPDPRQRERGQTIPAGAGPQCKRLPCKNASSRLAISVLARTKRLHDRPGSLKMLHHDQVIRNRCARDLFDEGDDRQDGPTIEQAVGEEEGLGVNLRPGALLAIEPRQRVVNERQQLGYEARLRGD